MEEIISMNKKELYRSKILNEVLEGRLTQVLAAKKLNISDRQVRKLLKSLKEKGDIALVSKKRGKPSNRCLPSSTKEDALNLIKQHYSDFGPKLAKEYLEKLHSIEVSKETLRRWMINAHLWAFRSANKKLHPPRQRRGSFGELIQVDGSHHDWFEGRSEPCVLMVFIDDATSMITSLTFAKTENLEAYFQGLHKHLKEYGVPLSIYGDRCSVLTPRQERLGSITQFHKALKELDCELLLARSPQAKGRVERANRTLQDRLVKMLRVRGVKNIEEADNVLEEYRKEHNRLFSKQPDKHNNAHRQLEGINLNNVLSIREERCLNKDFVVQFKNTFYQILSQEQKLYKKAKIEIRQLGNGTLKAYFKGKEVQIISLQNVESPILERKDVLIWKSKNKYIPPYDHPYRKNSGKNRHEKCI